MQIETQAFTQNTLTGAQYILFILVLLAIFFLLHIINGLTVIFASHAIYPYFHHQSLTAGQVIKKSMIDIPKMGLWIIVNITIGKAIHLCELWSDRWKDTAFAKNTLHGNPWYTATFFVVPLILFEHKSIKAAVQTSSDLVFAHWGRVNKNQFNSKKKWALELILFVFVIFMLVMFKSLIWAVLYFTIVFMVLVSAFYFTKFTFLMIAVFLFVKKGAVIENFYDVRLFEKVFYLSKR
jgi:hypothetical protein